MPFPKRPLLRALGWAHTTNYLALQNLAKNDQSKAFSFLKESRNITIYLEKYNKYYSSKVICFEFSSNQDGEVGQRTSRQEANLNRNYA